MSKNFTKNLLKKILPKTFPEMSVICGGETQEKTLLVKEQATWKQILEQRSTTTTDKTLCQLLSAVKTYTERKNAKHAALGKN